MKWSFETVKEIVEENGIVKLSDLAKINPSAYSYVVRNDLAEKLNLKKRRNLERTYTHVRYDYEPDITRVWVYLAKWAVEEGTTIRKQAYEMGYYKQYNEWVRKNGSPVPSDFLSEEDINTIKRDYCEKNSSI